MGVHVRDLKGDGKAWIVVYDRRVPKGYLRKYVGDDWKAAKRAASIIRERLAANDLRFLHGRSSAVPSLEEAVGQYLAERLAFQTIDPFTKDNYERTLRKHVFPVLGSVGVTAIQREDLKALFERLLAAKASKSLGRNILAPIKQTYEWLIDDRGLALQNPAVRLGKFLHETIDKKKRVAPLTPQDQAAFLRAARTRPRYFFLFLVALRAGLRLSECFGLQWTDFDLENRTVRIERQFREGKLIDRTKKTRSVWWTSPARSCESSRCTSSGCSGTPPRVTAHGRRLFSRRPRVDRSGGSRPSRARSCGRSSRSPAFSAASPSRTSDRPSAPIWCSRPASGACSTPASRRATARSTSRPIITGEGHPRTRASLTAWTNVSVAPDSSPAPHPGHTTRGLRQASLA